MVGWFVEVQKEGIRITKSMRTRWEKKAVGSSAVRQMNLISISKLSCCVIWGKLLNLESLSFPVCQMGIITGSTLLGLVRIKGEIPFKVPGIR